MNIKLSMSKRTIRITTALALVAVMAVVAVSLLMSGTDGATAFNADASAPVPHDIPAQYTAQCSNGVAVLYPANNPGLVADCAALLASKEPLEGTTGNLNWSADVAIGHWDGIDRIDKLSDDSEYRVLTVWLAVENLGGVIPPELGNLANLRTLRLNYNRLTGPIPPELGNLANLTDLRLASSSNEGNQFTGCVPASLRHLIDFPQLLAIGLPFCDAASVPSTPVSTPSATSTPTPTATRAPGITPVATPTPTATPAASNEVLNRLTALETQVAEIPAMKNQIAAMATGIARLEGASAIAPPTPTPTATPSPTPSATPVTAPGATPSPTPTSVAGTSGNNACITDLAGSATLTGNWTSDCLSANPSDNRTYYARFYTFTLSAPSEATITLSSNDASPYLFLREGAGTGGAVIQENGAADATTAAITATLQPAAYTIEASTWNAETPGAFTLALEITR